MSGPTLLALAAGSIAVVGCYDLAGAPANAQFFILVIQSGSRARDTFGQPV